MISMLTRSRAKRRHELSTSAPMIFARRKYSSQTLSEAPLKTPTSRTVRLAPRRGWKKRS